MLSTIPYYIPSEMPTNIPSNPLPYTLSQKKRRNICSRRITRYKERIK